MFRPTYQSTRQGSPSPRRRSCNPKNDESERSGGPSGPPAMMEEHMALRRTLVALVLAVTVAVIASARLSAQAGASAVPFKLGTFEQGGRTFPGPVLRAAQIVDIARPYAGSVTANAFAQEVTAPADLKQL